MKNILSKPHRRILEHERDRLRCDTAIYVGDDETDEDVFTLDQPGCLLGIRVGAKSASAASYCIPGQKDIDELLAALIEFKGRGLDVSTAGTVEAAVQRALKRVSGKQLQAAREVLGAVTTALTSE